MLAMLPFVQTKLAKIATNKLNEALGTELSIDKVSISIFGGVECKGVFIADHHQDTLLYVTRLQTHLLDVKKIGDSKILLGEAYLDGINFKIKKYKGESQTSLDVFISKVDDGKPGSGKFRLASEYMSVSDSRFRMIDENLERQKVLDFTRLTGALENFYIKGPQVTTFIHKLSLHDHRGLYVDNLSGDFLYNKENIKLKDMHLRTETSYIEADLHMMFKPKYFQDFSNKVYLDVDVKRSKVATNDLNHFYNEFAPNEFFYLKTHATGILNDFILKNLSVMHTSKSEIIGVVNFKNLFNKKAEFSMDGSFNKIATSYIKTSSILPRVLASKLPEELGRLGEVQIQGRVFVTTRDLDANIGVLSQIGKLNAEITLNDFNQQQKVTYNGRLKFDSFNIGALLNQNSLKLVTADLNVDGVGFTKKSLNTAIQGSVSRFDFNNYSYRDINLDGSFTYPYYTGYINSNDPNLKMDFDGMVNIDSKVKEFDFEAQVDYADLHLLNFRKQDSTAIFKGNLKFNALGNNLDDIDGALKVTNASYQNGSKNYYFQDFEISSKFDDVGVRTIAINSPEIIDGHVTGRFKIDQVQKIVENALGSLYANYTPYKLSTGQYLDFDFEIHNDIIEIFNQNLEVSKNTHINGSIHADEGAFKMDFKSPLINAYKNGFENINIQVDNKNPLYNAYIELDSIKTSQYKISDFNLINVTMNDTMYVRSEFKGGKKNQDYFNLNLYHTIDEENKSVVGFKKSEVAFKDFVWYINENNEEDNKIVFNKKLTDFSIQGLSLSHQGQMMELSGELNGPYKKDISLTFDNVDLAKLTPSLERLSFEGNLNGSVNVKQKDAYQYKPTSNLTIEKFGINNVPLGDMTFEIEGDERFRKFNVDSRIKDDGREVFYVDGTIDFNNRKGNLNLEAGIDKFSIKAMGPLLGSIFSDVRGNATGKALFNGTLSDPEINGRLYLDEAGMRVPYLGVDFNLEKNASIDVTEHQFLLRHIKLTDTKHGTDAFINGSIRHKKLQDWFLDLDLFSDNMLILDTKDADDAIYYGKAFINGKAKLSGPTNSLFIDIEAKSNPGTSIKLPLGDSQSGIGNNSFIHFLTQKEKEARAKGEELAENTISGIEMNFDMNITPDAEIEIILDRASGHAMKGRGVGTLNMEINTLGKFRMVGDYQIWDGEYNFKYGGIIDKKFVVKKYSTIRWADGNPMNANLNLQAIYKTDSNPAVLLDNPTINRKIATEVTIDLSGVLSNPEIDFLIDFPTVSSVIKSEINFKLSDKDTRQTQAIALLSGGGFMTAENAANTVYGSLFERASSLFSDIFSGDDDVLKVGLNYTQADKNPYVETEGRVGVTLSTNISEKISINGKLGVPVGGTEQSVIIGDVEVSLRLNEDGTLNARVFNRENDITYIGEGIGYTQGIGLTYQVDFDTFKELLGKIFKKAKEDESKATNELPDSDLSPDFVKFIESRRGRPSIPVKEEPKREVLKVPDLH